MKYIQPREVREFSNQIFKLVPYRQAIGQAYGATRSLYFKEAAAQRILRLHLGMRASNYPKHSLGEPSE